MSTIKVGDKVVVKEEVFDLIQQAYTGMGWDLELEKVLDDRSPFVVTEVRDSNYKFRLCSTLNPDIDIAAKESEVVVWKDTPKGEYEQRGQKLGALVDSKQEAYGNAIIQTYEVVKTFMFPYFDEESKTYTIPQSLLQHLLLQVRVIDKQNRIFNNPDFDLMGESPYSDLSGYGLLGANMVIDK